MVAITSRSFCNGPYFRPFREFFLGQMSFEHIHVFESRKEAFRDDDVLQENIIFRAVKKPRNSVRVVISTSRGPDSTPVASTVRLPDLINGDDPQKNIRIPADESGRQAIRLPWPAVRGETAKFLICPAASNAILFRARLIEQVQPKGATKHEPRIRHQS